MSDYPDFYLHVERTPIQPTRYQEIVVYNYLNQSVNANTLYEKYIPISNDGMYYKWDALSVIISSIGTSEVMVGYLTERPSGTFVILLRKMFERSILIELSSLTGLAMSYPNEVYIAVKNNSASAALIDIYLAGFRYRIE